MNKTGRADTISKSNDLLIGKKTKAATKTTRPAHNRKGKKAEKNNNNKNKKRNENKRKRRGGGGGSDWNDRSWNVMPPCQLRPCDWLSDWIPSTNNRPALDDYRIVRLFLRKQKKHGEKNKPRLIQSVRIWGNRWKKHDRFLGLFTERSTN